MDVFVRPLLCSQGVNYSLSKVEHINQHSGLDSSSPQSINGKKLKYSGLWLAGFDRSGAEWVMGFKSDAMVGTVDAQKGRGLGMMILGLDILNLKCPWHLQLKCLAVSFVWVYGVWGFPGGSVVNLPANVGDPGSIPGSGRSPREGNGNPLHYSCLENSMDRGTWWAAVHGVTKNQTWLSN